MPFRRSPQAVVITPCGHGRGTARSPRPRGCRRGFSLMELILATAILAASGAALFALIGQGAMFGGRADRESESLHLALTVLDEYLAMPAEVDAEGSFEQYPQWSYRIRQESIEPGDSGVTGSGLSAGVGGGLAEVELGPTDGSVESNSSASVFVTGDQFAVVSKLMRVVVEVRPAGAGTGIASAVDREPACRLVRWVRVIETGGGMSRSLSPQEASP